MSNVVTVRVGDCPCPGEPHAQETVTLTPTLTLPMASAALAAINAGEATASAMQQGIIEAYLPAGIREWTFTDEQRKPVPISRDNMERLLPWDKGGMELAEAADALYSETLMRPLVARIERLSEPSPTEPSTPPSPPFGPPPPVRLEPSSPDESAGKLYAVRAS